MLNPHAGWALTTGVLAVLTFCLPILGPVAIGLGWSGYRKAGPYGTSGGRGMALTGMILGAISLVFFGIFFYVMYL